MPEGFKKLHDDFPSLDYFEYHENIQRYGGQRSHNRYYLAYESSIYHKSNAQEEQGILRQKDLPESWQLFIKEIEEGPLYKPFIQKALELPHFKIRYAWHAGKYANEVSPHIDSREKAGTHIFYLNTDEDWDASWGGQIQVLGGLLVPRKDPDFKDFTTSIPVQNMNGRSFLFKNTMNAWHGVKSLQCPEGKYRKLFNVIFEY